MKIMFINMHFNIKKLNVATSNLFSLRETVDSYTVSQGVVVTPIACQVRACDLVHRTGSCFKKTSMFFLKPEHQCDGQDCASELGPLRI